MDGGNGGVEWCSCSGLRCERHRQNETLAARALGNFRVLPDKRQLSFSESQKPRNPETQQPEIQGPLPGSWPQWISVLSWYQTDQTSPVESWPFTSIQTNLQCSYWLIQFAPPLEKHIPSHDSPPIPRGAHISQVTKQDLSTQRSERLQAAEENFAAEAWRQLR